MTIEAKIDQFWPSFLNGDLLATREDLFPGTNVPLETLSYADTSLTYQDYESVVNRTASLFLNQHLLCEQGKIVAQLRLTPGMKLPSDTLKALGINFDETDIEKETVLIEICRDETNIETEYVMTIISKISISNIIFKLTVGSCAKIYQDTEATINIQETTLPMGTDALGEFRSFVIALKDSSSTRSGRSGTA